MRRNTIMAALAMAGLMGPMSASSPMVVVLDDDEDDVARLKRLEAKRYEQRERLTDGELAEKLGRRQPLRNVVAGINRHTGEPHKHRREIARRLRQQARKREQSS